MLLANSAYVAVGARPIAGGDVHIALLRRTDGNWLLLGADPLLESVLPQRLAWIPLDRGDTMFTYTHEVPVEGIVSTVASVIRDDSLEMVYFDGTVCRASEFRDLDGDGVPELLARSEPLSGGDCSSTCSLVLNEKFPLSTHWLSVRRWNGSDWVASEADFPAFYEALSEGYEAAGEWIRGSEAAEAGCVLPAVRWLNERGGLLSQWSSRASTYAAPR